MALTVGDRDVRPLTADEVLQMVAAGILHEDDHVELLHGVLTEVSPQDPPHAIVVQRLTRWLAPLVAAEPFDVRVQLPLAVPDPTSLPEPDIAVVTRDDDAIAHPTTALLVVEVADSSLRTDTTIKPPLYAAAQVPEYWVVDLAAQRLLVMTEPTSGGYASTTTAAADATVGPATLNAPPLALAGVFAGL